MHIIPQYIIYITLFNCIFFKTTKVKVTDIFYHLYVYLFFLFVFLYLCGLRVLQHSSNVSGLLVSAQMEKKLT